MIVYLEDPGESNNNFKKLVRTNNKVLKADRIDCLSLELAGISWAM